MPTNKLVVSNYLRYILITVGVPSLFTLVWQTSVLLTFFLAGVLLCVLNPLVRRPEPPGLSRAVAAVPGGFLGLASLLAALILVFRQLEGDILVPRIMGRVTGVHHLSLFLAILVAAPLYRMVGVVFMVPIVGVISSAGRYLSEPLVFERRSKVPFRELPAGAGGRTAPEWTRKAVPTGEHHGARMGASNG